MPSSVSSRNTGRKSDQRIKKLAVPDILVIRNQQPGRVSSLSLCPATWLCWKPVISYQPIYVFPKPISLTINESSLTGGVSFCQKQTKALDPAVDTTGDFQIWFLKGTFITQGRGRIRCRNRYANRAGQDCSPDTTAGIKTPSRKRWPG